MPWTKEQCDKLACDKRLIEKYFSGFYFVNPKDSENTCVEGYGKTKSSLAFKLQIALTPNYPHEPPHLYVTEPNPLPTRDLQSTINHRNSCHEYHTHDNGPGGCVTICYAGNWHAGMTINGVIWKGIIWMAREITIMVRHSEMYIFLKGNTGRQQVLMEEGIIWIVEMAIV